MLITYVYLSQTASQKRKIIAKTHWEDKASTFVSPEFVRRSKFEKLFINIYIVSNIKNLIRNIKYSSALIDDTII